MPGGKAERGTISANGLHMPPAVIPANNVVTIKARSTAYPSAFGTATLTISKKYPWLWSVAPSTFAIGPYSVAFNGSNFAADSQALANGVAVQTTFVSATKRVVTGTRVAAGTLQFSVRQPAPGAVTGNNVAVSVTIAATKVSVAPTAAPVQVSTSQAFSTTVTGNANTAVTWAVNGIPGGSAAIGTISAAGLYAAPAVVPSPSSVTSRATSTASPASFAQATVTVIAPVAVTIAPGTASVPLSGIQAFAATVTGSANTAVTWAVNEITGGWMLYNYSSAPDQLRQRVAYALSQIIVTSGNKLVYANESLPWLQLLSRHAFGNYRDLLRDVSKGPSMGKYLDLANSRKPGLAGGANENLPRELMRLFTIGLWRLNRDGSQVLIAGNPVPTYTQETVRQVALALTGWTYATAPGATPRSVNWADFDAPMETRPENHDTSAKTFLGCSLPAGQTVEADLDGVVNCLMAHPNIAPFVATQVLWVGNGKKNSHLFLQLLRRLADAFPRAAKLHVVLDNYGIHSSRLVKWALTEEFHGRIVLHCLPPHSPDHNRIERLWRELHANVTRNRRCATLPELLRRVAAFLRRASPYPGTKASLMRAPARRAA